MKREKEEKSTKKIPDKKKESHRSNKNRAAIGFFTILF